MNIERTKFRRIAEVATLYDNLEKLLLCMFQNIEENGLLEKNRGYYNEFKSDYITIKKVTKALHNFKGNDNENQKDLNELWRGLDTIVKDFRKEYLQQYRWLMQDMTGRSKDEFESLWKRVDGFKTQPAQKENVMDLVTGHSRSWFNA